MDLHKCDEFLQALKDGFIEYDKDKYWIYMKGKQPLLVIDFTEIIHCPFCGQQLEGC